MNRLISTVGRGRGGSPRRGHRRPRRRRRRPRYSQGRGAARRVQAPRRDLRGEPQLRQPVRRLGLGQWPRRSTVCRATRCTTTQVAQNGDAYGCLLQDDVNLASPTPLATTCVDAAHGVPASHFTNDPFTIDGYIKPDDKTCPARRRLRARTACSRTAPAPSPVAARATWCTASTRSSTRSTAASRTATSPAVDAVGLTMGHYDTKSLADLPVPARERRAELRHRRPLLPGRVRRVVPQPPVPGRGAGADRHQRGTGGVHAGLHSVVDANGFPNGRTRSTTRTPRRVSTDRQLTQACSAASANPPCRAATSPSTRSSRPARRTAGDQLPLIDDTEYPNIGDRLTAAGVSWNWYSGGWDDAAAGHPGPLFQYHHQPFNYWANYAPGQPGRSPPAGRDEVHHGGEERHAAPGHLRQAVRRGERAPGLRQRAGRAATTWSTCSRRS